MAGCSCLEGSGATSGELSVSGGTDSVGITGSVDDMSVYYEEKDSDANTAGVLVQRHHNVSFGLSPPALLHAARRFDREFVRSVNMSSSLIYDEKNILLL